MRTRTPTHLLSRLLCLRRRPEINSEIINPEFIDGRWIAQCDCKITIMAEGASCENYAFTVETVSPYRVVDQGCQDFIIDPEEPELNQE